MQPTSSGCSRRTRPRHGGFTLIEIMVVVAIIAMVVGLIAPNVFSRADEAKRTAAKVEIDRLMGALKFYKLDNGRYPTAEQGLNALVARPTASPVPPNWKPYIEKMNNDPWGTPYQYANPGVKGEVDVFSLGADGKAGGDGNDADIGSWQ